MSKKIYELENQINHCDAILSELYSEKERMQYEYMDNACMSSREFSKSMKQMQREINRIMKIKNDNMKKLSSLYDQC